MSGEQTGERASDGEDLPAMAREELIALVAQMREILRVQQQTLEEIVEERDAALLLNELCHY